MGKHEEEKLPGLGMVLRIRISSDFLILKASIWLKSQTGHVTPGSTAAVFNGSARW
jgi:hypothetical protein